MHLQSHESATESFNQITVDDSLLLGNVLGAMLKKRYSQLNDEDKVNDWITLDILLNWELWPNYVKIMQQGKLIYKHLNTIVDKIYRGTTASGDYGP